MQKLSKLSKDSDSPLLISAVARFHGLLHLCDVCPRAHARGFIMSPASQVELNKLNILKDYD